ncbi:glycogen debranching protein [Nitzschia inconspicua]|uniref:Glycogen debranching protein n=1 Tax=Nitzschia inconspicua TaxID=303405 RepID=A0A9K3LYR3_9STRA|nr:glycogen debranching protein [Nitzschia inconspicua]
MTLQGSNPCLCDLPLPNASLHSLHSPSGFLFSLGFVSRHHPFQQLALSVTVVIVAAIVASKFGSSETSHNSSLLTDDDVAIDTSSAIATTSNDDDAILNEHEAEIEEAEEALAEEDIVSDDDTAINNNNNMNIDFDLGSSQWFELHTGNDRIDTAYRLAMNELNDNIVDQTPEGQPTDPYFIAGHGWSQLWTRDTSYAIELGAGLVRPDVSLTSLLKCTEHVAIQEGSSVRNQTVWYQDSCGHFGGWPNLSDAIVGARGAWYLYVYTGNTTFLEWAFTTTVSSLKRAEQDVKRHGLFHGCSSFMESNSGYPSKYKLNGQLVGRTRALSTNMLYWNGYHLASRMGEILMADSTLVARLANQAEKLKTEIRTRLWKEQKGYYAYFEDENDKLVEQMEGLGEALVLLSEEFEESGHRIRSILDHTYRTEIGIPSLWPRFRYGNNLDTTNLHDDDHISQRYHNGRVWPFVSGYFAIAAAQKGRSDIFAEEMVRLIDLSEQQNTFAEFYELDKTFPSKRRRQLWSDTGYLGMIYQGMFGMVFEANGVVFAPTKPHLKAYNLNEMNDRISLLNVKYRQAVLDVHVTGFGNRVKSFSVNGRKYEIPKIDATVKGRQIIEITVTKSN